MKFQKLLLSIACLLVICKISSAQQVIVSDDAGYSSAAAGAMLDVKSTSKGFLPPRVTLTGTADQSTVPSRTAGLLIYNTATTGDVTPGYYYWDGNLWVKLQGAGSAMPTVTKTASTTLAKSENLVFVVPASHGRTDITLPAITTADDGLQIWVKNAGNYMDLVRVLPSGSSTIDGYTEHRLYRVWERTYIAKGGNWYMAGVMPRLDNQFEVSNRSSWQTIPEVLEYLADASHLVTGPVVIKLGSGNYSLSAGQTINFAYPITFEGASYGETTITSTVASGATFDCKTECYFKMIIFEGPATTTSTALQFSGTDNYHEVKDCYINNFGKGIVATASVDIWVFENDIDNAGVAAIEIASNGNGRIRVSETDFTSCAIGINLKTGTNHEASIINCGFYNATGGVAVNRVTGYTFNNMYIENNTWNIVGTFMTGFNFNSAGDANAYISNNSGTSDENPHVKINLVDNLTKTTCTVANTYYPAAFTNTSYISTKWTVANNKITYQPSNSKDVLMFVTGNVAAASQNRSITIGVRKNGGTVYGPITARTFTQDQLYGFATVILMENVTQNDYFEVVVSCADAGESVTVSDLNWFSEAR